MLGTSWEGAQNALRPQLVPALPQLQEQGRTWVVGPGLQMLPLTCKCSHKKERKGGLDGMAVGEGSEGLRTQEHPLGKHKLVAKGLGPV